MPSNLLIVSFPFYAHADVLFGKSYHKTLHTYFKEAETSITIAMYFIIINPGDKTNPVNELVNDIVDAKNRGVQVSDNTISSALLELEDKGIIKVTRDKPTPPDFATHRFITSNQGMGTGVKLIFIECFPKDNLLTTSQVIA